MDLFLNAVLKEPLTEPKQKKHKGEKKDDSLVSWKTLSRAQLKELDKWIAVNAMKENCRNMTLADLTSHVQQTYNVKVVHSQ